MNIQDYALDIGKSEEEVLEKMKSLKLITTDLNRALSDDEVILLDNAFQDEEDYVPSEDVNDEVVEDIALSMKAEQIAYNNNSYNKENKRAVKKNKNNKIIIVVLVILIIAAIGAGVYVAKNGGIGKKEENTSQSVAVAQYEVPDFVSAGYNQSDIENNGAWNKQFKLTFTSKYSTDVEEGIVFEQSIEAGKKVDQNTEIVLTVSKGVQTESVPNVAGQTVDEATKALTDKGFKVSTVEVYNDGSHTANTVKESYASAPAAGSTAAVGEEIVLQVYGEVQTTTAVEPENEIGTD